MESTQQSKQVRCLDLLSDTVPFATVSRTARGSGSGWQLQASWTDGVTHDEMLEHLAGAGIGLWTQACRLPRTGRSYGREVAWLPDGVFVPVTVVLQREISLMGWAAQRLRDHLAQQGTDCSVEVQHAAAVLLVAAFEGDETARADASLCAQVLADAALLTDPSGQ